MRRCDDFEPRLDELLDGNLEGDWQIDLESHLETCESCTRNLERLRNLRSRTAELTQEFSPGRDLWPQIADRIGNTDGVSAVRTRKVRLRYPVLAMAAIAVLAVGAAIFGHRIGWQQATDPIVTAAAAHGRDIVQVVAGSPGAVVVEDLQRASDELMEHLQARRDGMSTETWDVVCDNLAVIDEAIGRIAVAIENDPENAELTRLLVTAYQRQLTLLRQAANLPAEA